MRAFRYSLFLSLALFVQAAFAGEGISWSEAQTQIQSGENVRVVLEVEGREQILIGRAAQLDPKDFPGIFALVSNEGVFHMIDLDALTGQVERLPVNTDMSLLKSSIDLKSFKAKAPSSADELAAQKKLSDFLASQDKQIDRLALMIRMAPFAISMLTLLPYTIFWDGANKVGGFASRPWWVDHLSSFILSAVPMTLADIFNDGRNTERIKRSNKLLIAAAVAVVIFQAHLEIKGFTPEFLRYSGANVSDMKDFYVGAGTAGLIMTFPWLHKLAWRTKRAIVKRSALACRAFRDSRGAE